MEVPKVPVKQDSEPGAFPASEATPGQEESRIAFGNFQVKRSDCPWWQAYLELRAEGWDWRKAAYIAWASSPARGRWPETQEELADKVLGLKSDRTIRKWREKQPDIDNRIQELQVAPLMRHRRDVIEALVTSATDPDSRSHQDRKLFLEMTGDYKPRSWQQTELSGADGGPIQVKGYAVFSPDDWDDDDSDSGGDDDDS